jgi:dihydropteroate synthase
MSARWDALFAGPKRTLIMAIVNATPDSFSGDGLYAGDELILDRALAAALAQIEAGADILDIGGESTRPGANQVSASDEIARIEPLIQAIRARSDIVISIDTFKAEVAQVAIKAGADVVNDVHALAADPDMPEMVARAGVPVVLMHNSARRNQLTTRAVIGGQYDPTIEGNICDQVIADLRDRIALALAAGIKHEKIIVDPGLGFGKTIAQNLELIDRLDRLRVLGCPILSAPSRKSFIGAVLNLDVRDRVEGTAAAIAMSIARGADIVRVHDTQTMVRVARMTDAITRR